MIIRLVAAMVALCLLLSCSESDQQSVEGPGVALSPPDAVEQQLQSPAESSALSRPNIVFILVDDMGFGDVGYNGSEIATPNLDEMAQQGMKLDRNYVYPVCSPTRAALLSGQNPLHMGITGPIADDASLPEDLKLMPEYFKDLGYRTHMVGKWHLGLAERSAWPSSKGFDSYYGFLGGWIDFYTHVFAGGHDWQRDGQSIVEEGHATDLMTDEVLSLIKTESDQPFLIYLAYNAPHSPLQHPPVYSGLNDYPEVSSRSVYAEMVTHLDMSIGRIFDGLEDEGVLENTIVVFSSDNGGALNLGGNNGELRGGKRYAYEGGMRVPGLIRWPGRIQSGATLEQPISVHDWLPTLLEATGEDPAAVVDAYGQSMWAAISRGEQVDRHPIVMGATGNLGVIEWPFKLVAADDEAGETNYELFNVVEDPKEQNDLAELQPDLVKRLVAEIEAMPVPEFSRLEPEFNNSPRYYSPDKPDWEQRLQAVKEPWAEAAR